MSRSCGAVVSLALLVAPVAQAADCPALTRVGISEPADTRAREHGLARQLVDAMARRTGCKFELSWYPPARLYQQFSSKKIDMVMAALRTPERDRDGDMLPYGYSQLELVLRRSEEGKYRSLAQFVDESRAQLNVPRGISFSPELQRQLDRLQRAGRLEYVNDYAVAFKKISFGRTDGTLAPPPVQAVRLAELKLDQTLSGSPISEAPRRMVGIYVSRSTLSAPARKLYARTLYGIVADGTAQKIYIDVLGVSIGRRIYADGNRAILDAIAR
ncbi:MAG: transporter substrate-binding domain-containing protein [Pseudomonadota bacterium]